MKIVQVAYNWDDESGGISLSTDHFAQALHSTVISFTKLNGKTYRGGMTAPQLHIPYHPGVLNRYAYSRSHIKRQAEQLIKDSDMIIIHGLYRYHIDWAINIATKNNIPYIIVPHGSLDPYVFTYRTWQKKLWLTLKGINHFKNASAIIFATDAERNKALAFTPSDRSFIVHWPVDFVDTTNCAEIKIRIRGNLGIPQNAKVLVFVGRFHPMKRPIETIKVVSNNRLDNVYLIMIGPDSDELSAGDCERYCMTHNINNVRFVKPVYGRDKLDYFMSADAFISLSFRENFGYTVAEALSSGIPVILSPGNDLSNDIRHLNCGWLIQGDTLADANKAVREFVNAPREQLVEMGKRGQQWARAELSFETYQNKICSIATNCIHQINNVPTHIGS